MRARVLGVSALLLAALAGCRNLDDESISVTVDPEIGTVVHVAWETRTDAEGWVEYGPDTSYDFVTPLQRAGTSQQVTLFGVPADSTWHYRVVTRNGDETTGSPDGTFTTDPLPAEIPALTVETFGENTLWGDYTLFSWWSVVTEQSFVAIADRAGDIVWYWIPDWGYAVTVRLADDGTAIYALCAGIGADPDARIVKVPLDGGEPTVIPTPNAHHDFYALGDTLVYIQADTRDIEGEQIMGDLLVEVDADGAERVVWDAFESFRMERHAGFEQEPADWTHGNGVGYIPEQDAWLLSLFYDRAVVAVSRETGQTIWQLGGIGEDIGFPTAQDRFGPQHSPSWVDGELLLFDNAYEDESSRLIQYEVDVEAGVATPTWQYQAPAGMSTHLMGDATRLPDGGAVSGWGELEEIRSVDRDGTLVRTISLDAFGLVGQVERMDELYPVGSQFPNR